MICHICKGFRVYEYDHLIGTKLFLISGNRMQMYER
jgi:hypothetical protein